MQNCFLKNIYIAKYTFCVSQGSKGESDISWYCREDKKTRL